MRHNTNEQEIRTIFDRYARDYKVIAPGSRTYYDDDGSGGTHSREHGWEVLIRGTTFAIDWHSSIEDCAKAAYCHNTRVFEVSDDGEYLVFNDPLPWVSGAFQIRHTAKATLFDRSPSRFDANAADCPKVRDVHGRIYEQNGKLVLQAFSVTYEDGVRGTANIYPQDLEARSA